MVGRVTLALPRAECAATLLGITAGRKLLSTDTPTIIDYMKAIRSHAGRVRRVVPRVLQGNGTPTIIGGEDGYLDVGAFLQVACAVDCMAPITANCSADEQAMLSFMMMDDDNNMTECPAVCNDMSVLSDVCHAAADSYATCVATVSLDSGMIPDEDKAMVEVRLQPAAPRECWVLSPGA